MHHIAFRDGVSNFGTAILVKASALKKTDLLVNYVHPLSEMGVPPEEVVAFSLNHNAAGKAAAAMAKEYLNKLLPALQSVGVKTIYCTDSEYFKQLTGVRTSEPHLGYALPCRIAGFESMTVILGLNYQQLIYNPALQSKLDLTLKTVAAHIKGTYQAPGSGIIHSAQYPTTPQGIAAALDSLMQYPKLSCDIEAFSLRFNEAGIGTIAFAWDKHNGIAFACDYQQHEPHSGGGGQPLYGNYVDNAPVKKLLKQFFIDYKGEITWHNGVYDIEVIIYNLWMKPL